MKLRAAGKIRQADATAAAQGAAAGDAPEGVPRQHAGTLGFVDPVRIGPFAPQCLEFGRAARGPYEAQGADAARRGGEQAHRQSRRHAHKKSRPRIGGSHCLLNTQRWDGDCRHESLDDTEHHFNNLR